MQLDETINQTTEDILLQQAIETNQQLEQIQNSLTLIQSLKNILTESIKNVLNVQLKKQQDAFENQMKESKNELGQSRELHKAQLSEFEKKYDQTIQSFRDKLDIQINSLRQELPKVSIDNCKKITENACDAIEKKIDENTNKLDEATSELTDKRYHYVFFSFVLSIILVAASFFGLLYLQNYRDGMAIAEAKAEEVLADERMKFENEMEAARNKLANDMQLIKTQIENDAVLTYVNSKKYREDACKLVASNISNLDVCYYLYIYTKSKDIEKYKQIKAFYYDYLKSGYQQYLDK